MPGRSRHAWIKLADIEVGERFRKDYGDLESLGKSIDEHGELLQPLVVKETDVAGKYLLLAGGRRYAAHIERGLVEAKADIWPADLTELECRKIELAENIKRKSLTWQEELELTAEVERLLKKEKGDSVTQQQVAELLGKDRTIVTRDLQLSKDMLVVPELREAKTKKDALIKANALRERIIKNEIARRVTAQAGRDRLDTIKKKLADSYVLADCLEYMPTLKEGSFDLVEFDPPYGIGFDKLKVGRSSKMDEGSGYTDFSEVDEYLKFIRQVGTESFRILKDTGWILTWCSVIHAQRTLDVLEEVGFLVNRLPIIWVKPAGSVANNNNPDIAFNVNYEVAVYARKTKLAALNMRGPNSTFHVKGVSSAVRIHPSEKPTSLMGIVLLCFVPSGAKVFCPCAGSGNTLFTGIANKAMTVIGTDTSETFRNAYLSRVALWNPNDTVLPDQPREEILS